MKRGRAIGNLGRAPVPEWEEVARAAWPGRLPVRLTALAGRAQLPVLLLSLCLLLLAAWLRLPWLGLAAWTIGAATEWLATPADTAVARLLDLVGMKAQVRALLRSLPALVVVFVAGKNLDAIAAGLGYLTVVLLIQLAWTCQPILATWLSRGAPPLRYLPGAVEQPASFAAHARAYARGVGTPLVLAGLEFVALAKALASATGGLPLASDLVVDAVVALAVLAYLAWTVLQARRLQASGRRSGEELITELSRVAPSFLIYVSLGARQSKYIVNQWLPGFDALAEDGLLLAREASQLSPLAVTRHPVVYAPSTRDVERLTFGSVRAAFYLAYGERNGQLLREPGLKHVMLLHGDSDKATSANGMARAFDEIWVAGPAAIQRYRAAGVAVPADRFVVIGRPQVAGLQVGPSGLQPSVLLYAPTFEGYYNQTSHSSLDVMGVELVRRLLTGHPEVQVWFRPHPASGVTSPALLSAIDQINALLRATPGGHVVAADRGLGLTECLARADLLVSDISSVATDFLYTERPVITCDPAGLPTEQFVAAHPTQSASYLLRPGLSDLDQVLADALGADPMRAARLAMKRHVLGDTPDGPQSAFAANVARITS